MKTHLKTNSLHQDIIKSDSKIANDNAREILRLI
jgi:hypothetical protein